MARRAGVGIATLYRRFPDRHALLQAVALDNPALIGAELERATAVHADPWDALELLIRRLVELRLSVSMPMLLPGLTEDARSDGGVLKERRDELFGRMRRLLRAAQRKGQLRRGINPIDLWFGVVKISRPLPVIGDELNELIMKRQLELFLGSLRAASLDAVAPLGRPATPR